MPKLPKTVKVKPNLSNLTIKVKIPKTFIFRVKIAVALIKVAGFILGVKTQVEKK